MNSPQLFENIEKFVEIKSIVPVDGSNDDYRRHEYQYNKWKCYPYVSNSDIMEQLSLVVNDERVRIFDTEKIYNNETLIGELQLIHYLPPENSIIPSKEVDVCRGLIFFVPENTKEHSKCVARSYPYTPEYIYLESEKETLEKIITDFNPTKATLAHEGTIIRLFYFHNKWYFSTHRRINGLRSRWTGEAFGKILERVCPDLDTKVLNKDYCYVLLLEDQYTGLVCSGVGNGNLYHTCTYDMTKNELVKPLNTVGKLAETLPADLTLITNRVKNINALTECGVILKNKHDQYLKILNSTYASSRQFLDNEPSLAIRYLQLRPFQQHTNLAQLLPRGKEKYEHIEYALPRVAEYLGHLWYNRNYKRNFLTIDQKCYETLRSIQFFETIFAYTRNKDVISLAHVKNLVVPLVRRIDDARHMNNIIKLMSKDYKMYHETQTEWSNLFNYTTV